MSDTELKDFVINDPICKITIKLQPNHCLFCKHCTDYFASIVLIIFMIIQMGLI